MPEIQQEQSVTVETPLGKLGVNGGNVNTFFTVVAAVAASLVIYLLLEHKHETGTALREANSQVREALKGINETNKEMLAVQREQLCLLALPAEKRERELAAIDSWCKRIAR